MKRAARAIPQGVAPKSLGWVLGAVGSALLVLYGITLTAGAYPGISAAYLSAALGFEPWGVTGHPAWRLFLALWSGLPGRDVWVLNASSAFCGALSAVLCCRYVACRVYADIWLRKVSASRIGHAVPPQEADEERRASLVSVASGVVAAGLLGTGQAAWGASTRLQPECFDLVLIWAALILHDDYTLRRGTWRLYALALLCGLGAAETTMFWLLTPFWAGSLAVLLYKQHRLRLRLCLGLVGVGLVGLSLYAVAALLLTRPVPGGESVDAASVLWHLLRAQLAEVALYVPGSGWLFVLLFPFVPWVAFQVGYWWRLHRQRDLRADVLLFMSLAATLLVQFNAPLPPWDYWRLLGRLPVLEAALAAMLGGWTCAYWLYGALFRWEPAKRVDRKDVRNLDKLVRQKRWASWGACSLLLVLSVTAACCCGWRFSGCRSAFVERCAEEVLDQLGDREWLVTDGVLDTHLVLAARRRGRPLRVLSLSRDCEEVQVRRLKAWIESDARLQPYRERLRNAAGLGVGAFVRAWLAVDPKAEDALALYGVPELWSASGLVSRPDRFLYVAKRSADGLGALPLLEDQRAFWARMRRLLPSGEVVYGPSDRLRGALRSHLSVVANDLGVLLMDLGRNEEAFDALGESLKWDSRNLSALANRALLVEKGVRPAEKERVEAALKEAAASFKRPPLAFDVVCRYGQLRTPEALVGVGAAWARLGQYGLAEGGLRRAAALAGAGGKRNSILACLGGVTVSAGETGQGEEIFRDLLRKEPQNLSALMGMLTVALRRGDAVGAKQWLYQARLAGAPQQSLVLGAAQIEIVGRDYAAARVRLLNLTDKEPKNLDAWVLLSVVMIAQQQLDDVERLVLPKMEAAANKQPNAKIYQVRGDLARARGPAAYQEARDMYRRALKLGAGWRDVLEILIDLDLRMNDLEAAGLDASDLLRVDPGNADGHFVLGSRAVVRGELDAAESHLRASVARDATPQALNNLAEVLLRKGAVAEAEDTARMAVAKDDKSAAVWDTLASVLLKRAKVSDAAEAIGHARTLAPGDWSLALTEARILMAAGRKEEAHLLLKDVQKHLDVLQPSQREEVARVAREWKPRD